MSDEMNADRSLMALMPADTPAYAAPAWLSCVEWAIGEPSLVAEFRVSTGNQWRPGPSGGLDWAIDLATGADWAFIVAFVGWVNTQVWGTWNTEDDDDDTE